MKRTLSLRPLFAGIALLLLVTPRAQAAQINLLLTVDFNSPTVGPPEIGFGFNFFSSPSNGWLSFPVTRTMLASGGAILLPGVTEYNVSLDAANLNDIYFSGSGTYQSPDPFRIPNIPPVYPYTSIYVAEPPTGNVRDDLAYQFGPPWITLADLDDGGGLSGIFYYINGYSRGDIGTWAITAAAPDPAPVPEPASLLLLGTGLAAVFARFKR